MNPSPITVGENGVIANADGAEQVVTLGKSDNGFTLLNGWSKYIYMSGTSASTFLLHFQPMVVNGP